MRIVISLLACFLIFAIGCSGGGGSIVTPDAPCQADVNLDGSISLLVESFDEEGNPINGSGILGIYQAVVDTGAMTAEMVPIRNAALDDVLEMVDITNFLQLAPCIDCAKIFGIEIDDDSNVILKIGIKHPFPPGDPFKPITGRNRGDLHVFNVEGTVIFKDGDDISFPSIGATTGAGNLINADGYSPYLNFVIDEFFPTSATVHPYILHFDDYSEGNFNPNNPTGFESVTIPPPMGNLVMAMGSDYDIKDYVFSFGSEVVAEFMFAVGCTYAVSAATRMQRFNPEYQVPQHNKKAASEVMVEIINNQFEAENDDSYAELMIKVLDMNHGVPVGTGLDEMLADSSVSGIQIEVPGVTNGAVSADTTPTGGDGRDPENPLTFPATIYNDLAAPEGVYRGLVKVTDSYPPGLNTSPLLNGMDGIKRVDPLLNPLEGLYTIPEFATYQVFQIEVELVDINTPPVAVMCVDEINVCSGSHATINASCSYDLEDDAAGIPLKFEYDYHYDGIDFISDTGPPAEDPIHRTLIPFEEPGPYTVAVRVTDSEGLSDIATATIYIDNTPSVSDWNNVTDGSSIQNVRYFHTTHRLLSANRGRAYGLEGMAQGNGYVYLAFFTDDGSIYFTRTNDSGVSWDDPELLVSGLDRIEGVSIAAAENEVFVVYGEHPSLTLTLLKNTNSGEGSWESFDLGQYSSEYPLGRLNNIGVAVDPNDSNYVYVLFVNHLWNHFDYAYVLRNENGGEGTWHEHEFYPAPQPTQGRQLDIKVNSDSSVYIAWLANMYIGVARSDDHGVSWTSFAANRVYIGAWGGEMDMAFDPTDPNVVYILWTSIGNNDYHKPSLKLARSTNRAGSFSVVQNNLIQDQQVHVADIARQPAIACDQEGNVFVSYTFGHDDNPYEYNVFVRKSCDMAGFFSEPVKINVTDDGWDVDPELIISPQGGIVVTWAEDGYSNPDGASNPTGRIVSRHLM